MCARWKLDNLVQASSPPPSTSLWLRLPYGSCYWLLLSFLVAADPTNAKGRRPESCSGLGLKIRNNRLYLELPSEPVQHIVTMHKKIISSTGTKLLLWNFCPGLLTYRCGKGKDERRGREVEINRIQFSRKKGFNEFLMWESWLLKRTDSLESWEWNT